MGAMVNGETKCSMLGTRWKYDVIKNTKVGLWAGLRSGRVLFSGTRSTTFTGQCRLQGKFPPNFAVSAAAFWRFLLAMPRSSP